MTQVSQLKLVTLVIIIVLMYIASNGDNENYIQISEEGKSTVCVDHLDGSICNYIITNYR